MSADPSVTVYLLAALPLALNVLVHGAGIHLALRYEIRLEKRNLRARRSPRREPRHLCS